MNKKPPRPAPTGRSGGQSPGGNGHNAYSKAIVARHPPPVKGGVRQYAKT